MKTALRTIIATVAGLLVAFALVIAVEMFGAVVHPLPEDFGNTTEEMCRHVENYPPWVLAVVVPTWAFTGYAGVWVAQKFGNRIAAAIVGLLIIAALVMNLSMLPYPVWFKIASLLVIPTAMLIGFRRPRPQPEPPSTT